MTQIIEISAQQDNQRFDNFLKASLRGIATSRIYKMIRKGEVRVNGSRKPPQYKLLLADKVRIPPFIEKETPSTGNNNLEPIIQQNQKIEIIFEDEAFLVIDKPSGLASHGGSGQSHGAIEYMRSLSPQNQSLSLAHRLDAITSGVLILCKRRSALVGIHEAFREGLIHKEYLAVVHGSWKGKQSRIIDAPLHVIRHQDGLRRAIVSRREVKESITMVHCLSSSHDFSLVKAVPQTGRMHQIRAHLSYIQLPIVGDPFYGAGKCTLSTRLLLHAHSVSFTHPLTHQSICIEAPIPQTILSYCQKFKLSAPLKKHY